ncbi:MAG: hypothetical protein WB424_14910 [Terracidiphilus sp.]
MTGMTFNEIAEELGISRGSVYATYLSAIKKLQARPGIMRQLMHLADQMHQARLSRKDQ